LDPSLRHQVRRVVVVVSGSRCGSSFLFRALRGTGAFWTPNGEETPFYRLCGVGEITNKTDSDAIAANQYDDTIKDQVAGAILNDLGRMSERKSRGIPSDFLTRLLLQQPQHRHRLPAWEALLDAADGETPEQRWWNWFMELRLRENFYDGSNIRSAFEGESFEEPPWVVPAHTEKPTAANLNAFPLLLKMSTNVYRMEWLKSLFPNAEFQWIFLKRNVFAAVNGLMDGWLSDAFHSHDVSQVARLQITGYSEYKPGGERWWKFDLPPTWAAKIYDPLERVCAFQWTSAYEAIFNGLKGESHTSLFYEDLQSNPQAALEQISRFIEKPFSEQKDLPVTMATKLPRPGRWHDRFEVVWPFVQDRKVRELSDFLGYDVREADRWI
jgi:hypothetical protein